MTFSITACAGQRSDCDGKGPAIPAEAKFWFPHSNGELSFHIDTGEKRGHSISVRVSLEARLWGIPTELLLNEIQRRVAELEEQASGKADT